MRKTDRERFPETDGTFLCLPFVFVSRQETVLCPEDKAAKLCGEKPFWSLNTDSHLRSALMGRSVTIPIIDGELQMGEFGRIWFGD